MKNIGASVGAVPAHEKKEAEVEKVEEEGDEGEVEEEYRQMENEMIFCLDEAPEYQISAVAEWGENSRGDMVVGVDTYFRHIETGQRCRVCGTVLLGGRNVMNTRPQCGKLSASASKNTETLSKPYVTRKELCCIKNKI